MAASFFQPPRGPLPIIDLGDRISSHINGAEVTSRQTYRHEDRHIMIRNTARRKKREEEEFQQAFAKKKSHHSRKPRSYKPLRLVAVFEMSEVFEQPGAAGPSQPFRHSGGSQNTTFGRPEEEIDEENEANRLLNDTIDARNSISDTSTPSSPRTYYSSDGDWSSIFDAFRCLFFWKGRSHRP